MRWPLPLLLAYLLLAIEPVAEEYLRLGTVTPSLVLPLVVYIALMAAPTAALWTALLIGLAVDLTTLRSPPGIVVAGPHALGYLAAAYLAITVRPLVMRRNPITVAALSFAGGALAAIIVVAIFALRKLLFWGSWADPFYPSLMAELWRRMLGALYTGGFALLLSGLFIPLTPWFGFQDHAARRPFVRRF